MTYDELVDCVLTMRAELDVTRTTMFILDEEVRRLKRQQDVTGSEQAVGIYQVPVSDN